MIQKLWSLLTLSFLCFCASAQGPEITSWLLNTGGATGYSGITCNVQQVQYSANNVYISASCIPSYTIGPWAGNPNAPTNQSFVYKLTRSPQPNTGTLVTTPLGHTGVLTNGVSVFNALDAMSYNNQGIWNRNAYYYEGPSFDNCGGHPAPNGEYHHHVNPSCLYNSKDSSSHSPLIGYAFDGYPIYGAYAYTNTNGTGAIKRMISSYVLSTATTRTNGPAVSSTYPAGCFCEDYIYTAGSGDLDAHNGRFCVTPEYPAGTYAYFVTTDQNQVPVYPFVIGTTYYGTVQAGNTGPGGGHNTITEPVTAYTGNAGIQVYAQKIQAAVYPNPAGNNLIVLIQPSAVTNFTLSLMDVEGRVVFTQTNIQPAVSYSVDVSKFARGTYVLRLKNTQADYSQRIILQ